MYIRKGCFLNENVAYLIADKEFLVVTKDGGKTWERIQLPKKVYLTPYFIDEKVGWLVGEKNTILKTNDGGKNLETVEDIFVKEYKKLKAEADAKIAEIKAKAEKAKDGKTFPKGNGKIIGKVTY